MLEEQKQERGSRKSKKHNILLLLGAWLTTCLTTLIYSLLKTGGVFIPAFCIPLRSSTSNWPFEIRINRYPAVGCLDSCWKFGCINSI